MYWPTLGLADAKSDTSTNLSLPSKESLRKWKWSSDDNNSNSSSGGNNNNLVGGNGRTVVGPGDKLRTPTQDPNSPIHYVDLEYLYTSSSSTCEAHSNQGESKRQLCFILKKAFRENNL